MEDEFGAFPATSCAAGDDAFGDFDAFAGGEADNAFGGLGGEWGAEALSSSSSAHRSRAQATRQRGGACADPADASGLCWTDGPSSHGAPIIAPTSLHSASAANKEFARQFALVVVTPTDRLNDMVARSGPWSLFSAMSECFPDFVKGDTLETREGLQEAEFNKALQAGGFQRERDRRVDAPAKNSDPLGAGTYLFSKCEWKDPANDKARNELYQGFQHLAKRFPSAARCCSFSRFLA